MLSTEKERTFLSGPGAKILCSRCRGQGFDPWFGNQDPACCTTWPKINWKTNNKQNRDGKRWESWTDGEHFLPFLALFLLLVFISCLYCFNSSAAFSSSFCGLTSVCVFRLCFLPPLHVRGNLLSWVEGRDRPAEECRVKAEVLVMCWSSGERVGPAFSRHPASASLPALLPQSNPPPYPAYMIMSAFQPIPLNLSLLLDTWHIKHRNPAKSEITLARNF